MKSPLRKRIPRELKGEIGKYLVVFILMVATIGLVSGFLVADGSMIHAYNEGFEKYNIEDGNFRLGERLYRGQKEAIEDEGIKVYESYLSFIYAASSAASVSPSALLSVALVS